MEISFNNKVNKLDQVLLKQIGDASVLLNLQTESYYGLDSIGYDFYQKLVNAKSIQEAYLQIIDEYDAAPEILRQDLIDLITNLIEAKIISIHEL